MPEICFGPFTLDPSGRKLRRGAETVQLPSRAVDALAYLIAHRDRVVEKDEIIAAVWHDVAVTDDSLIHAVSVIRRALGDDPAHAAFVETIPRRGYRFVGEVEVRGGTPSPDEAGRPDPPPALVRRRPWHQPQWRVALAASVAVMALAGIWMSRDVSDPPGYDATVSLQQIAPPGTTLVSAGVISPTGGHLALVARDERTGRTALWIRAVDAAEAQPVSGTVGASNPFFSPDGRTLAFFVNNQLVATDLRGGQRRVIATMRGAPAGGTWGTNNTVVFAEWTTGLSSVPAAGGPVTAVTHLDHEALDVAHAWPQFLPDGRHVLYQIVSPDGARAGVYVATLDSGETVRLLDGVTAATYVAPGYLVYLRDEMLMAEPFDASGLRLGGRAVVLARHVAPPSLAEGTAVSASREMLAFRAGTTERQLTWVDRAGDSQGSLKVPASMFNFRVSPDGRSVLAASSLTNSTGVWLVDVAHRRSTHVAADGIAAIWSPDGGKMAYTSRAGLDLRVHQSGGEGRIEPLVSDTSVKVLNDWSSRGDRIIYTRHDAGTLLDLWHVPVAGGDSRPLLRTPFNEAQARISSDGRWLAYMSDSSGVAEVYVRRYPDMDAPRQVSTGGGSQPQWRADRQELFYLAPDRSLMAVTLTAAGHAGTPRRLFRTAIADSPADARESYAAMPDGRSFLIDARRDETPAPITVMRHWASGLAPPAAALAVRHDAGLPGTP